MHNQIQLNEVKARQDFAFLDSESSRLRAVKDDLDRQLADVTLFAGKLKNDSGLRKTMIEKLKDDIKEIKDREKAKKEANKKLLATMDDEQKKDSQVRESQRKEQQKKISDLQKQLRKTHAENMRLRQEYQKLAETLQTQVTQDIYKTFEENDFF